MDSPVARQALAAAEESRLEAMRKAARLLLEWQRPVEEVMEVTGLSREEVEGLNA